MVDNMMLSRLPPSGKPCGNLALEMSSFLYLSPRFLRGEVEIRGCEFRVRSMAWCLSRNLNSRREAPRPNPLSASFAQSELRSSRPREERGEGADLRCRNNSIQSHH